MIGIIADDAARYTWFHQCLANLSKPAGTEISWRTGTNRGDMRNALAQECIDRDCEWIFFIDDDQAFHSKTLVRLLAHKQPVVSALIFQRSAPFLPTVYVNKTNGSYYPLDLTSVGHNDLVRVVGTGAGGLLINAEVLHTLRGDPWFVYSEHLGEDLFFCNRLEEAGIPVFVDTGCRMGHIAPSGVFPHWNEKEKKWEAEFKFSDGTTTYMDLNHHPGERSA